MQKVSRIVKVHSIHETGGRLYYGEATYLAFGFTELMPGGLAAPGIWTRCFENNRTSVTPVFSYLTFRFIRTRQLLLWEPYLNNLG